jgi:hypothetical protein
LRIQAESYPNHILLFNIERSSSQLYQLKLLFRPDVQDRVYWGFQMRKVPPGSRSRMVPTRNGKIKFGEVQIEDSG